MRYSTAFAAASALSVASAGYGHDHALFHKRHHNVTDQCTTVWKTWYGEATMVPLPPPPKPTTTKSTTTSKISTTPSATPTTTSSVAPTSSSSAPAVVKQASVAAPLAAAGPGTNFFGVSTGKSGMNAITLTAYQGSDAASSGCLDAGSISQMVSNIHNAGFNTIRLYATDCGGLVAAGDAAKALGMSLILGIFPNSPGSAEQDMANQLSDIQSWIGANGADNVVAILVGNEPFAGGHASVDQIAEYLQKTKAAFPNIQVSTALTHAELTQYGGQLCSLMDMVAAQVHPFFSTNYIAPSSAGDYVESEMEEMSAICGGKPVFVSETGYPNNGGSFLGQIAGAMEQQAAVSSLQSSSKSHLFTMFSSSPDTWKLAPGVQDYEAAFDCLGLF